MGALPADLTSFVGRRRERSEVRRLLANNRLVVLTGCGGVGKTRLGVRVAADLRRAFPDGVFFVGLAALTNPDLLPDTVAKALGLQPQSLNVIESLIDYLASRNALILLDNCEHLIGASASLVDTLLRGCPDLHVLATSREPLGIVGEAILPVLPLSVPPEGVPADGEVSQSEAVSLFVDRARAAVPGFQLTPENRGVLAEVCRRLDGIPLALELAAVRLRALSPHGLLDRLTDRLQLLSTGSRSAPDRQRTLRGSIEWSYELCTPQEQEFWALASVFHGGFELDAARAVCCPDPACDDELVDTLLSMVDKSILVSENTEGRMRYRMLEVIRQYGRERLRALGQEKTTRLRHRDFYAELAARSEAEWAGPRQREWMDRMRRDHPNIQAALYFSSTEPGEAEAGLRIAAALREHWITLGALWEGRHWLDRLLVHGPVAASTKARALYTGAWLGLIQDDLTYASSLIDQGLGMAELDEDASATFDNLSGFRAVFTGDIDTAVADNERALATFRATGNVFQEIGVLTALQMVHYYRGDIDHALRYHAECMALTERIGESWYRSYSMWQAGVTHWQRGDHATAIRALRHTLRLKREIADGLGLALCVESLAWVMASRDVPRAAVVLGIAAARLAEVGTPVTKWPWTAGPHNACEAEIRRILGDERFRREFERGAKLDPAEGIRFALEDETKAEPARAGEKTRGPAGALTPRQQEVAKLVANGLSNKEIAGSLVISQRTAETHVEHILAKLGFTSRAQIAAWLAESRRT